MTTLRTELLVIGGGATGAGVAWDAVLRGYDVILAERRDLGEGTSGRFHGLLHSGGRYAVKDPDAAEHGGRVLSYHTVVGLHRSDGAVTGARLRNELTGEELDVEAAFTINASGAWAAQIAEMGGAEGVHVAPGKGIMIAMNHRLVHTVVNRCTMPADGDIIVPIRTVSVIGTTDERVADPDELPVTQAEVDAMLDDGER